MIPEHFEMIRALRERFWWYSGRRDLFGRLLRRHLPDPASLGLDAGCGPGTNEALYAASATRWLCVDLDRASFSCWKPGPGGQCALGRLSALPLRDGAAEVILLLDVLEHVEHEGPALTEVHRALRPGGLLLASVPAFRSLWSWHDEQAGHHRRYRLAEIRRLAEAAGFELREALHFNALLTLPIFLVRRVTRAMPSMRHRIEADLSPGPLNGIFSAALKVENCLAMRGFRLPWGTTALVVARKPVISGRSEVAP